MIDSVLQAVAEPHRRRTLELLAQQPMQPAQIGAALGISPQALSRHLKVLRKAGLVEVALDPLDARRRTYRIRKESLAPLRSWVDELEQHRKEQLNAFAEFAESIEEA